MSATQQNPNRYADIEDLVMITAGSRWTQCRAFAIVVGAAIVAAPVQAQSILRVPGKTVEVVGLRRWTISMIQDSLAKYAPGTRLESHACAAVLRNQLGFADAAALVYQMPADSIERVVVIVVEPQDSARVRYRTIPLDTVGPRITWQPLIETFADNPGVLHSALSLYPAWQENQRTPPPEWVGSDSIKIRSVWRLLATHRKDSDRKTALRALRRDRNYRNRMAAAAILANFTHEDRVLHGLVKAQLESDGPVKSMAESVLSTFAQRQPRPVDWKPVAPELHAILRGTSLFQLRTVMRLLVATSAGPDIAVPLLRGGGDMLLALLAVKNQDLRMSAHALLVALRGADLGSDVGPWRDWIGVL